MEESKKYIFEFIDSKAEFTVEGYSKEDALERPKQMFVEGFSYKGVSDEWREKNWSLFEF